MRYLAGPIFVLALSVMGCSEPAGTGGNGGSGGSQPPPPPPAVDQSCRDWCANEPEGFSCHQGPPESVQQCYEGCLEDYQREAERQCGDEWLAIKDCQVDLECEDLFGDCESVEDMFDECVRIATNRDFCEANCPDFDITRCEQDTTGCLELVQANRHCELNCSIVPDREECIGQYLSTGACRPECETICCGGNSGCPARCEESLLTADVDDLDRCISEFAPVKSCHEANECRDLNLCNSELTPWLECVSSQ